MTNSHNNNDHNYPTKTIRVAILAEELLSWSSGKEYFTIILNNYSWKKHKTTYTIHTTNLYDKDILKGKLTTTNYELLLVPGGGVGDGESIVKGLTFRKKNKKWKNEIANFIKNGGGYVGICGGAALITPLINEKPKKTFIEHLYNKSALGVSKVTAYYKTLAFPLFSPHQHSQPEIVGASAYVFSFAPGESIDGKQILTSGVPIDFPIRKDNPIFYDYPKKTIRILWWGGPALIVPKNTDREIKILATYPATELSEDPATRIFAWKYLGGIHGLIRSVFTSLRFIKNNQLNLRRLPLFIYYFAGYWQITNKPIELNFAAKPAMTAEIYPNQHQGRIILCTSHPEYLIWYNGHIESVSDLNKTCIATGFHQWKDIDPIDINSFKDVTNSWWIIRRMVAWAAKIGDDNMPPISREELSEQFKKILINKIRWNGTLLHQISHI